LSGWLVLNLVRTQDGYGNEGDRAETGDQLSDEDESDEDEITHAVPFKCIGAAHEKNYQHHLEQACLALHGQDKPVCICHVHLCNSLKIAILFFYCGINLLLGHQYGYHYLFRD
jgi:hypothetical protein